MTNRKIFSAVALMFLVLTASLHAASCSNRSLEGTYSYSGQGFIEATPDVSPAGFVPWAQAGLTLFDGRGGVSFGTFSAASTVAGGGVNSGTFSGIYVVKGNCTGSAVITTNAGDVFHFDLIVTGPATSTLSATRSRSSLPSSHSRSLVESNSALPL
jgi:hypothetical protein